MPPFLLQSYLTSLPDMGENRTDTKEAWSPAPLSVADPWWVMWAAFWPEHLVYPQEAAVSIPQREGVQGHVTW